MIKCSKSEVRRLKSALRWKNIPSAQRERIQMVLLRESGMTQPAIAAAMGARVLSDADLSDLRRIHPKFVGSTPFWYYVLREAEVLEGGDHLGPVGGRIVMEVFLGLVQTDPTSYLSLQPDFTPSLGPVPGEFHIIDFLTFAGVAEKR